jgi:thiol:disulfide interchange protein DsbD
MKPHKLKSGILTLFLVPIAIATMQAQEPDLVQVNASVLQKPDSEKPLVIGVDFDIADGYHVYADPEKFNFKLITASGVGNDFELVLPPTKMIRDPFSGFTPTRIEVFEGQKRAEIRFPPLPSITDNQNWRIHGELSYQACSESICLPPETLQINVATNAPNPPMQNELKTSGAGGNEGLRTGDPDTSTWQSRSLLLGILAAFAAGVALSLTPCVYPMIGITVAVIGGQQASRGRTLILTLIYVLGLSLTYAAAGVIVASLGSTAADFFRSPWVLGTIACVFILLGLSMFDLFSIATPAFLNQRLQKIGGNGSALGVLLMGCLSAFVVGPCVSAPLIGLITFVATTGDRFVGFVYFFALAWGMGAILFLAGAASGMLPRSGDWMIRIKHAIGVVIFWAAAYFVRPVAGEILFYAATLALPPTLLFVLGAFQLPSPEDEQRVKLRKTSIFLAALALVVVFNAQTLIRLDSEGAALGGGTETYRIDLSTELAQGKPVLLDFWAPWCAICKEIERDVLNDPELQDELAELNLVKVHYDYNPELKKRFELIGPPAFVVLAPDNEQRSPVLVGKDELRKYIEQRGWR